MSAMTQTERAISEIRNAQKIIRRTIRELVFTGIVKPKSPVALAHLQIESLIDAIVGVLVSTLWIPEQPLLIEEDDALTSSSLGGGDNLEQT